MKYVVTVSVAVVGEIEVEAATPILAAEEAKKLARMNRGEALMSQCIDVDPLSVCDETGETVLECD